MHPALARKTQGSCLRFTPLVTLPRPERRREALGQVARLLERPEAFPRRWPEKQATVPMLRNAIAASSRPTEGDSQDTGISHPGPPRSAFPCHTPAARDRWLSS